ncbi:MAG: hypothetical protein JJU33_12740 [Phycisphaerales bacterium]|nr:hypothetical protein [Phycisphaerales bacterium]
MNNKPKRRLTLFAALVAGAAGQAFAAGPIFIEAPGVALEPRPEVADAWFATIDLGPILSFEAGQTDGTIQIPVSADITLNARITRADRRGHEDASWGGQLTDIEDGSFVFAQYADGFFGAVWAPGVGNFEVRWSHERDNEGQKIFSVLELNPEGFDPCGVGPEHVEMPPGAIDQIPAARVGPSPEVEESETASPLPISDDRGLHRFVTPMSACTPLCTDDGSVIDMLIAYTPAARAAAGSDADIRALIRAAVDATNDAYDPSEINTRLNLVYTHFTDYDETGGTNSNHLARIRGVNNGYMDEVHPLRNRYRADLVALITDTGGSCGVAYLSPFNAASGFSVTRWSCAVGNLTFAHEVGHNQGCAHDADNANSSVFTYGFGWRFTGTNGVLYRTVMAYSPGARVPRFSNPDVSFQGTPTGAGLANNVRAINNTRESIAAFRLTGGTDCNNNGIDDFEEIAQNPSLDLNNNCILDECEVPVFVDASAPAGGDGKTWATAYNDLNSLLGTPRGRCDIPREIWVAAGTYVPNAPGNARAATFNLSNGDRLIGGFGGFETSIEDRDPELYPTVLSGDRLGDDGPNFTNREDNVYTVVTIEPGSGSETVIDGFTIRGGNADGTEFSQNLGGAVMVEGGASVTIRNTTIKDNAADFGAAVYLRDAIGVTIEDSIIRDNLAFSQGAGVRALRSGVTIERSSFIANSSSLDGGALSFSQSSLEADRVMFAGNTGRLGGAYYADQGSTLVSNSVFTGNQSTNLGGAAYLTRADPTHRFINSTFADNTASNNGGAIRAWNTNFIADNSVFAFNTPQNITEGSLGTKQVRYSLITGGYSGPGNINAEPVFVDRFGPDGVPGTGDEVLALDSGSPGIDAGNNTIAAIGRDLDFAGNDRFFDDPGTPNTGVGEAPIIDMGAYELQPAAPTCPPDLNGDGVVDADDFFLFLQLFAAGDPIADFNNDGVIDADDFFAFLSAFADGCP